ncbi:hypothetical protein [Paenibacillus bouchesdurhonensis]|uniref:hypothetical protein n=1 Tax=Paenibacillus bouchesdurhonensis TaxID=1870990 RepID=UPI000DA5FAB2|nr:hypothetical protein [Paenibacillus bouchesdurhonensis]
MKDADWERLLRRSLDSAAEPDEKLNQSIINELKERSQMKHKFRKRLSTALVASILLLVLAVSAYAATQLFSTKQVDGKPMPNTDDPDYGKDSFFISPLIQGQKPWLVNIVTMNGGYNADRGVYLAISSGGSF